MSQFVCATSNDEKEWTLVDGGREFVAHRNSYNKVYSTFKSFVEVRYVRIRPTMWHQGIAMRAGLLGPPSSSTQKFVCSKATLVYCLRRNFGGVLPERFVALQKHFIHHIESCYEALTCGRSKFFFHELSQSSLVDLAMEQLIESKSALDIVQDSLSERLEEDDNPNTAPFRYVMIIDPTNSEAGLKSLFDRSTFHCFQCHRFNKTHDLFSEVCDATNTMVVRLGDFPNDAQEAVRAEAVLQVKTAMEEGLTCIVINGSAILASFYDALNR